MQAQKDTQLTKLEILINEHKQNFSSNEKILADFFLENENNLLNLSVPQIAEQCSVSQATVVRFCKHLGFSGLKDFKIFYQTGKIDVKEYLTPVSWQDCDKTVYYKVFTSAITAMQETFKTIKWETLSSVAKEIAKASNIDAFAIGGSSIVATYFANEFIRLGKRVNAHTDIYTIRHFAQEFRPEDLALFVSRSGENLTQLATRAKNLGCKVVAITCNPESTLACIADFPLIASETLYMENDKNSYSRIAEISIISVLFLMSALNLGRDSIDFIKNYSKTTNYEKL